MEAILDRIHDTFAFAVNDTHGRIFLHGGECDGFELADCQRGDVVDIERVEPNPNKGAMRGRHVRWLRREDERNAPIPSELAALPVVEGVVSGINWAKKFCFVTVTGESRDLLAHISSFADFANRESGTFDGLSRGERVRGHVRQTSKGPRMEHVTLID